LKILDSAMSNNARLLKVVPFQWAEAVIYSQQEKKSFLYRVEKRPLRRAPKVTPQTSDTVAASLFAFSAESEDEDLKWVISPRLSPTSLG
jgi:hypothetical protein